MSTQDIPAEQASPKRDSNAKESKEDQEVSSPAAGLDSAQGEMSDSSKPKVSQDEEREEREGSSGKDKEGEDEDEDDREEGEELEEGEEVESPGPPLPNEPAPSGAPLPAEPLPEAADDGWDCQWDPTSSAWYFYNRFTGTTQWDNPRQPSAQAAAAPGTTMTATSATLQPPVLERPAAGGYNPAIHGDYDPNAWYAQGHANEGNEAEHAATVGASNAADPFTAIAQFNRFTGQFQTDDQGPSRHGDEAKSRRQMNSFFDVDAAANAHDGRSLKAERSNMRVSKSELKQFKEKRRAKKEEKRRAWLRD